MTQQDPSNLSLRDKIKLAGMTQRQFAAISDVSLRTAQRWIKRDKTPFYIELLLDMIIIDHKGNK